MNSYQQGTAINLVETFSTIDALTGVATPADPATVTVEVQHPDGTVETFTYGSDGAVTNPAVGVYVCLVGPYDPTGTYSYEWTGTGNSVDASSSGVFEVTPGGVDPPVSDDPAFGPCEPWTDGASIVACGDDLGLGSDLWRLSDVAVDASAILYELSGRLYAGGCPRTVRPCGDGCSCWHDWTSYDPVWTRRGCRPTSTVKLGGSVRTIDLVKMDGVPLPYIDSDGYPNWRVDDRRDLVRLDSPLLPGARRWPGCQNLSLNDDQPGTFSITYTWGVDPPTLGRMAAASLARELWTACAPGLAGECKLPTNVTQVVRQGITIERRASIASMLRSGSTGLPTVDAFLASVNPAKARRAPAVWSPDVPGYAR